MRGICRPFDHAWMDIAVCCLDPNFEAEVAEQGFESGKKPHHVCLFICWL